MKITTTIAIILFLFSGAFASPQKTDYKSVAAALPKEIALAKQAGIWLDIKDVDKYKSVPIAENAALIYEQAKRVTHYPNYDEKEYNSAYNLLTAKYNTSDVEAAGKILEKDKKLIEYVRIAVKLPYCVSNKDWHDGLLVNFSENALSREISRVYALKAQYDAENHNYNESLNDINTAVESARQITNNGTIISQFVRCAEYQILERALIRVVIDNSSNYEILSQAQSIMQNMGLPFDVVSSLPIELFLVHNLLQQDYQPTTKTNPYLKNNSTKEYYKLKEKAIDTLIIRNYTQLYTQLKPVQGDYLASIKIFNQFDAKKPSLVKKPGFEMLDDLLPTFTLEQQRMAYHEARKRLIIAYIEILKFKSSSTYFPSDLSKLKKVNIQDPFSNKPFIYRHTDSGFTLYSVGENMVDDGGNDKDIVLSYP